MNEKTIIADAMNNIIFSLEEKIVFHLEVLYLIKFIPKDQHYYHNSILTKVQERSNGEEFRNFCILKCRMLIETFFTLIGKDLRDYKDKNSFEYALKKVRDMIVHRYMTENNLKSIYDFNFTDEMFFFIEMNDKLNKEKLEYLKDLNITQKEIAKLSISAQVLINTYISINEIYFFYKADIGITDTDFNEIIFNFKKSVILFITLSTKSKPSL